MHDVGGIEGVVAKGVVAKGRLYKVDCIVFATGFEVGYNAEKLGWWRGPPDAFRRHSAALRLFLPRTKTGLARHNEQRRGSAPGATPL